MPIRKRRPEKHLSKNQVRLARREGQERMLRSAGTLSTRFPGVSRVEIQMEFVTAEGQSLSSERRVFDENTPLELSVACQGRCGNGQIDMEGVVSQMINARQTHRQANGRCAQILFAGSSDTCRCELRCSITATYLPTE